MVNENLSSLDFGAGNAEHEIDLKKVFVETPEYKDLLQGRYNLVIGTKGSGKSHLFGVLAEHKQDSRIYVALSSSSGSVEYEKLFSDDVLKNYDIDGFRSLWKKYIAISLAHKILHIKKGKPSDEYIELERIIDRSGLKESIHHISDGDIYSLPESLIEKLIQKIDSKEIDSTTIFKLIEIILTKWDMEIWGVLDRLDESVLADHKKQQEIIDSLFVVLKDLSAYKRISLVVFLREDLYRKVTYPHLDHFHSRMRSIEWDRDKLLTLIAKRILLSLELKGFDNLTVEQAQTIFNIVFENKIPNSNAKNSFDWMYTHLMDGRGITTPRDLILLANKSKDEQRSANYECKAWISRKALVKAYSLTTKLKLDDLKRVYPSVAQYFNRFSDEKVKNCYGKMSVELVTILFKDKKPDEFKEILNSLILCGFLRPSDGINPLSSKKFDIPFAYKAALGIKSTGKKKEE